MDLLAGLAIIETALLVASAIRLHVISQDYQRERTQRALAEESITQLYERLAEAQLAVTDARDEDAAAFAAAQADGDSELNAMFDALSNAVSDTDRTLRLHAGRQRVGSVAFDPLKIEMILRHAVPTAQVEYDEAQRRLYIYTREPAGAPEVNSIRARLQGLLELDGT